MEKVNASEAESTDRFWTLMSETHFLQYTHGNNRPVLVAFSSESKVKAFQGEHCAGQDYRILEMPPEFFVAWLKQRLEHRIEFVSLNPTMPSDTRKAQMIVNVLKAVEMSG